MKEKIQILMLTNIQCADITTTGSNANATSVLGVSGALFTRCGGEVRGELRVIQQMSKGESTVVTDDTRGVIKSEIGRLSVPEFHAQPC